MYNCLEQNDNIYSVSRMRFQDLPPLLTTVVQHACAHFGFFTSEKFV